MASKQISSVKNRPIGQQALFDLSIASLRSVGVDKAISELSLNGGVESRGAIYTKKEVVDFILDLVGYKVEEPLSTYTLLEPSCGDGDFLYVIIERLLNSWKQHNRNRTPTVVDLSTAICAVEIHSQTFESTLKNVQHQLVDAGVPLSDAKTIANAWLVRDDFLLYPLDTKFDFVVGNPPYVRQENIPNSLLTVYRAQYKTMYDRADLYVPFIERSLDLLKEGGVLGFICADRWMKNKYGGPLRALIDMEFRLKYHVDLTGAQPFLTEVSAYPAITVISREPSGPTRVVTASDMTKDSLTQVTLDLLRKSTRSKKGAKEIKRVSSGNEPWLLEHPEQVNILRKIESAFPKIEEVGCKVGIGVATGADSVFISDYEALDVEPDRKLPLATTKDLRSGEIEWKGLGVINPYKDGGGLVYLEDYPRLKKYMEAHHDLIAKRHCAKNNKQQWYKTIDRIYPALAKTPKLLIPDINGEARIVYEKGELYPHHNLYYITSDEWDLRALQAILLSKITSMCIGLYTTRMRGGYPRYQAQYLRRLRLPLWSEIAVKTRRELIQAAKSQDVSKCTHASLAVYKLSLSDQKIINEIN